MSSTEDSSTHYSLQAAALQGSSRDSSEAEVLYFYSYTGNGAWCSGKFFRRKAARRRRRSPCEAILLNILCCTKLKELHSTGMVYPCTCAFMCILSKVDNHWMQSGSLWAALRQFFLSILFTKLTKCLNKQKIKDETDTKRFWNY